MTEEVKDQQSNDELELKTLRERAKLMGLKHHHKAGLEKMRILVNNALEAAENPTPSDDTPEVKEELKSAQIATPSPINKALRNAKVTPIDQVGKLSPKQKAGRLVRIRVNCMNPDKTEWEGQIFSVGNSKYSFKKYVPFNNDEGWYVPHMIYQHLKDRKCQIFRTQKDDRGNKTRVGSLIHEFAVELMDPLTPEELKALAQRQAMAAGSTQ